jgi:membrane protease YdiL (CAAX protease family)
MTQQGQTSADDRPFSARHPIAAFFIFTFSVSWLGAGLVAVPHFLRHEPLPKLTGILMFPAMLLGPCLVGMAMITAVKGPDGIRDLFRRMFYWRFPAKWYLVLLIPPALVLGVLFGLETTVSPSYAPHLFLLGLLFGVPAGFLEEIGWMGYAFPRMRAQYSPLLAGVLLGLLWSAWHIPVIDYLGAATPHRPYLFLFFLSFTAAMTAMRVLICWAYSNTRSVLLAQLIHMSSTGSLVVFSVPQLAPAQEVSWYALYGAALWVTVAVIVSKFGKRLQRG